MSSSSSAEPAEPWTCHYEGVLRELMYVRLDDPRRPTVHGSRSTAVYPSSYSVMDMVRTLVSLPAASLTATLARAAVFPLTSAVIDDTTSLSRAAAHLVTHLVDICTSRVASSETIRPLVVALRPYVRMGDRNEAIQRAARAVQWELVGDLMKRRRVHGPHEEEEGRLSRTTWAILTSRVFVWPGPGPGPAASRRKRAVAAVSEWWNNHPNAGRTAPPPPARALALGIHAMLDDTPPVSSLDEFRRGIQWFVERGTSVARALARIPVSVWIRTRSSRIVDVLTVVFQSFRLRRQQDHVRPLPIHHNHPNDYMPATVLDLIRRILLTGRPMVADGGQDVARRMAACSAIGLAYSTFNRATTLQDLGWPPFSDLVMDIVMTGGVSTAATDTTTTTNLDAWRRLPDFLTAIDTMTRNRLSSHSGMLRHMYAAGRITSHAHATEYNRVLRRRREGRVDAIVAAADDDDKEQDAVEGDTLARLVSRLLQTEVGCGALCGHTSRLDVSRARDQMHPNLVRNRRRRGGGGGVGGGDDGVGVVVGGGGGNVAAPPIRYHLLFPFGAYAGFLRRALTRDEGDSLAAEAMRRGWLESWAEPPPDFDPTDVLDFSGRIERVMSAGFPVPWPVTYRLTRHVPPSEWPARWMDRPLPPVPHTFGQTQAEVDVGFFEWTTTLRQWTDALGLPPTARSLTTPAASVRGLDEGDEADVTVWPLRGGVNDAAWANHAWTVPSRPLVARMRVCIVERRRLHNVVEPVMGVEAAAPPPTRTTTRLTLAWQPVAAATPSSGAGVPITTIKATTRVDVTYDDDYGECRVVWDGQDVTLAIQNHTRCRRRDNDDDDDDVVVGEPRDGPTELDSASSDVASRKRRRQRRRIDLDDDLWVDPSDQGHVVQWGDGGASRKRRNLGGGG